MDSGVEEGDLVHTFDKRDWIELVATVILSLAVILAAFSAYQASLWGGVQSSQAGQYTAKLTRWSDVTTLLTAQTANDSQMMSSWLVMAASNNEAGMHVLEDRFAASLKPAFEAWLATAPDGEIPPGLPQDLPEYREGNSDALELRSQLFIDANDAGAAAAEANAASDKYVFMTVIMASIMFFAGVGTKLRRRRMRIAMLAIAGVFFSAGLVTILSLPRQPIGF